VKRFAFAVEKFNRLTVEELSESFVTGLLLGAYQFNEFKTLDRDKIKEIEEAVVLTDFPEEMKPIQDGVQKGRIISEAVCMARDLVNGPGNQVTPTVLAAKAEEIARRHSMEVQVFNLGQAESMGMGAFVAVAKGSQEPAKFIVMEHNKNKGFETIALVGKGITFDSEFPSSPQRIWIV
jgi:leucyl aminopeptidase